jgi:hypothetical protein
VKIARLLPLLLLLALAVAPFRMFGGEAAAMPHHGDAPMAMEHCLPGPEPRTDDPAKASCAMACTAIPALGSPVVERVQIARSPDQAGLVSDPTGITPEAATPPPRAV